MAFVFSICSWFCVRRKKTKSQITVRVFFFLSRIDVLEIAKNPKESFHYSKKKRSRYRRAPVHYTFERLKSKVLKCFCTFLELFFSQLGVYDIHRVSLRIFMYAHILEVVPPDLFFSNTYMKFLHLLTRMHTLCKPLTYPIELFF